MSFAFPLPFARSPDITVPVFRRELLWPAPMASNRLFINKLWIGYCDIFGMSEKPTPKRFNGGMTPIPSPLTMAATAHHDVDRLGQDLQVQTETAVLDIEEVVSDLLA